MKVTYNSPNRSHHYRYAAALARAGVLHAFVSGFSRFSSHAVPPGVPLVRADHVQNFYLTALRLHAPPRVSEGLAHLSKWSMLDVFVVAVLVVLIRSGGVATIKAQDGLLLFCASVVLTQIASEWTGRIAKKTFAAAD